MKRRTVPTRYAHAAAKVDLRTKLAFVQSYYEVQDVIAAAKAVGISESAGWGILYRPPSYRQQCSQAARDLPKETRQQFLDLMREGKSFRVAIEELSITQDAALGILNAAMKTVKVIDWTAK